MIRFNNKNILLGITGSISIYKSCEVIRLFIKAGANVYVIMTESATKFISPLTFEALTRNKVLYKDTESWSSDMNHIDIGKKANILIISPATANTINKIANGISDNILLETILAFKGDILISTSANTNMIHHPITLNSIKKLSKLGYKIIKSESKLLACGENGDGALAHPLEIFYQTSRVLLKSKFWENRKVIITGGGTREKIDDIRYISNYSSGKMANSLVKALYLKGADIIFISTEVDNNLPKEINIEKVESSQDILESLNKNLNIKNREKKPYLFMCSAVSDFIPVSPKNGKIKKKTLGDIWNLKLKKNIDILKEINKRNIISIGFKAEIDKEMAFENAKNSLKDKNLNAICLNILKDNNSFGTDINNINFITRDDSVDFGLDSKINLSFKIIEQSKKLIV